MKSLLKDKKGGVVTSTVMGVGGLIVAVIITLVLVKTIIDADLFEDYSYATNWNNQTVGTVNETAVSFGNYTLRLASCTVVGVQSMNGTSISSGNYTEVQSDCTIAFTGIDLGFNNTEWVVNSTTNYALKRYAESTVTDMSENFSVGISNISGKIPTILLIVAVVFLFGVLALLLRQARNMGVGGEGGSL